MKVLEYLNKEDLKPIGGPAGYLYNLSQQLNKIGNNDIYFIEIESNKNLKSFLKNKIKNKKKLYDFIMKYRNKNRVIKDVNGNSFVAPINLNDYDLIHFHGSLSMYMVKDSLKDFKGKVIFTTHSPKVSYKEIIEDNTLKKDYIKYKKLYDDLEKIDEFAFNNSDYIMLPVMEAEDCYYNTWDKYVNVHKNNKNKYFYIPTGIVPIDTSNFSKENIRKEYNIPDNAFVVCYVGRHNEVKGYDQLKLIANEVLKKNKNIYFLIAGKEEPIKGLDNERWIEVGWTNRAHEIINACDLFILPNKETYFDLILLEVMSIGKPVLLTNTGGNKYFKKFTKSGLFYYNYGDNSFAINEIIKLSKEKDLFKKGDLNKKIFLNNFTIDIFTNNYLKVLENIYNEKNN